MEKKITMIPTAFDAALACATDRHIGGPAGDVIARVRTWITEPKSAFVSDPRPLGPLV